MHVPGQVLPAANAATIADRLRRWSCFCSTGSAEKLGGHRLSEAARPLALQVHVHVTDALVVNTCIHAMEEHAFQDRRSSNDEDARYVARLTNYCQHHQAALAKKPSLLLIPGLCSGLVRMCYPAALELDHYRL